ncbi:4Fe-4S cluster-binding domain-containing protein [Clostridium botulinum]|uniref:4Fe-4S cluster-binding domain-containing protein n=1 Tax=Clostridium botulinum TaxID=1491 RepID=UPI000773E2CA|nr:4Fe-4S cluster-binding domain-containing protein [Clostridium botulinum]MBN3352108.1 ribonucleoside-triphosphate reductase [Clostridium botulinum]MBN3402889.1 ribonucleoside-triphosphate reductase [Clostridium botulinum]MBN3447602.1 ribonucleoside-triphosphate reductase [Clostridium botulinum]
MKNIFITTQFSISGDGLYYPAISIYFSGCDKKIKCADCHNPELQKQRVGYGTNYIEVINDLDNKIKEWLTIYPEISICYLGGEALAKWNREATYQISKHFKDKYQNKICNIIYTWRYLKDLREVEDYISYIDIGVLGDYQKQNHVVNQIPSSSNQFIYDFNRKIKLSNIIKED